MKKIIVYGLSNIKLRREIEYFLDENNCIIGYSDSFYNEDVVDGKQYISPNDLNKEMFDYIIIAAETEKVQKEIVLFLKSKGIEEEKIIIPELFLSRNFANKSNILKDISNQKDKEYDGLIFGLSYSKNELIGNLLKGNFYNFARDGLDFYYNLKSYIFALKNEYFKHVSKIIFMIPYYYFKYDMSKSLAQYQSGQIFVTQGMNDWHNFRSCAHSLNYVISFDLFGKKYEEFYSTKNFQPINCKRMGSDTIVSLDSIWDKCYEETEKENIAIFTEMLELLYKQKHRIIIITPPICMSCLSEEGKKMVEDNKKRFFLLLHSVIGDKKIEVYDYTYLYENNPEYFYNVDHLNFDGSKKFTEIVNNRILLKNVR